MDVVDEFQEDLKTEVLEKTEENVNDLKELYNDVLKEIGDIDESTNELSMTHKFTPKAKLIYKKHIFYTHIFLSELVFSNYKPAHPIVVGIRLQYSATSSPATQAKHSAVSALQHGSTFWLTFSFLSKILIFFEGADTSKIFKL